MNRDAEAVLEQVEALGDEQMMQSLAELFKVMSDPTRLRILAALLEEGQRVGDLASRLDMSMSAISHQLGLLRRSRLVRWQRSGREVYYALDDDHIALLFRAGLEHCCHD